MLLFFKMDKVELRERQHLAGKRLVSGVKS